MTKATYYAYLHACPYFGACYRADTPSTV
jgi:hypothetical protein